MLVQVHHSRNVTFQTAEVAVSKEVWAEMLARIDRLRWRIADIGVLENSAWTGVYGRVSGTVGTDVFQDYMATWHFPERLREVTRLATPIRFPG